MNIALAIMYLYPDANPMLDFMVKDNGTETVIHEGVEEKGRVRYEIKLPEIGEESVEGVHYRYGIDYNLLVEGKDYDIVDRGQFIAFWNLQEPQPTEEELQAAWVAYLEAEANKPPKITDSEKILTLQSELTNAQLALTDTYEQLIVSQEETTSVQLALADVYEQLLLITEGGK